MTPKKVNNNKDDEIVFNLFRCLKNDLRDFQQMYRCLMREKIYFKQFINNV